jgi:hypothetical protein
MATPDALETEKTDDSPKYPFDIVIDPITSRSYDVAFADPDANIVLQSSDGIYYRIPSFTLRTTSFFFRGMMTLPSIDGASPDSNSLNGGDPITLDERGQVLGRLLRMISGFETSKWKSLDEVEDFLAAAYKYDMPGPVATARTALVWPIFADQPLRLYAIAAQHEWEEEAKMASRLSLSLCIHDNTHTSVLARVPSGWLLRLFHLHRARRVGFKELVLKDRVYFGISSCASCGKDLGKMIEEPWLLLTTSMLWEIERCPAGGVLLDAEWKRWPDAEKCKFTCGHCRQSYDYWFRINSAVKTALRSLPSTI